MKFKAQARYIKHIMTGETYRGMSKKTGISLGRLQNLIKGEVELTVIEAHKLSEATQGCINLLGPKFISEHMADKDDLTDDT